MTSWHHIIGQDILLGQSNQNKHVNVTFTIWCHVVMSCDVMTSCRDVMWCHVTSWRHDVTPWRHVTSYDVMTSWQDVTLGHDIAPMTYISYGFNQIRTSWKSCFLSCDLWPWPINLSEILTRSIPLLILESVCQTVWLWEHSWTDRRTDRKMDWKTETQDRYYYINH